MGEKQMGEKHMGEEAAVCCSDRSGSLLLGVERSGSLLLEEKRQSAWREVQSRMEREEVEKKWKF